MNSPARQARNRSDRNSEFDQSTARSATTRSTQRAGQVEGEGVGLAVVGPHPPAGKSTRTRRRPQRSRHAGADRRPQRRRRRQQRLPPRRQAARPGRGRGAATSPSRPPATAPSRRGSARGRPPLSVKMAATSSSGIGWGTSTPSARTSKVVPGTTSTPVSMPPRPGARGRPWRRGRSRSRRRSITLRPDQLGVEEARRPGRRAPRPGPRPPRRSASARANCASTLASTSVRCARRAGRTPSGTRWRPSTAATGRRPARGGERRRGRGGGSRSG